MTDPKPLPSAEEAHAYGWRTRDGESLPLAEIGITHLRNIERQLLRLQAAFQSSQTSAADISNVPAAAPRSHAEKSLCYIRAELLSRGYVPAAAAR